VADCPGLNAVIRAMVRKGEVEHGDSFVGFCDGWKGLTENLTRPLNIEHCRGILPKGGTILGTSRTNPYKIEGGVEAVRETLKKNDIDVLVAIGGDDTLGVAHSLSQEGVQVVGVPKTIDNDLSATDVTFGFHTAMQIATDAIDRLHTTAESHNRVFRLRGDGPPRRLDRDVRGYSRRCRRDPHPRGAVRHRRGCGQDQGASQQGSLRVDSRRRRGRLPKEGTLSVSSGKVDAFGHAQLGGIGPGRGRRTRRAHGLRDACDRTGHIQRGGTPTAYDRVLATRFGLRAIGAVHEKAFGKMVALKGDVVDLVPLGEAVTELKTVGRDFLDESAVFFRLTGRQRPDLFA